MLCDNLFRCGNNIKDCKVEDVAKFSPCIQYMNDNCCLDQCTDYDKACLNKILSSKYQHQIDQLPTYVQQSEDIKKMVEKAHEGFREAAKYNRQAIKAGRAAFGSVKDFLSS